VSPAKPAELIKMPFGGLTRDGPNNHIFAGGEIPPQKGASSGVVRPTEKHLGVSALVYAAKGIIPMIPSSIMA